MKQDRRVTRGIWGLVPLQLVILGIGMRYVAGSGGVPKLIGWVIVGASLITLIGYALAIWRAR